MDTWYLKELGDGIEAYQPSYQIMEAFTPVFAAAGCPHDMAVFSRYDLKTNMVTVYFSPSASGLAKAFNASPCEKPVRPGLGLLVGDVRSWTVLFPDV